MTAVDLDRIESELNLALPKAYRDFMQSGKFGEGDEGCQDFTGIADEVIERTKKLRGRGFFGAKWPDNYVVIGDDGAGDYYFTDIEKESPAVFFADHELTSNKGSLILRDEYQCATFSEFWNSVEKFNKETDLAIEREEERRKSRRWWQFWVR